MERYFLRGKIMRLTRMLLMVTVMVACTTQSLPAWAQSAELVNANGGEVAWVGSFRNERAEI
jgi:hypothetical protein